jgi:hypothetical protein
MRDDWNGCAAAILASKDGKPLMFAGRWDLCNVKGDLPRRPNQASVAPYDRASIMLDDVERVIECR